MIQIDPRPRDQPGLSRSGNATRDEQLAVGLILQEDRLCPRQCGAIQAEQQPAERPALEKRRTQTADRRDHGHAGDPRGQRSIDIGLGGKPQEQARTLGSDYLDVFQQQSRIFERRRPRGAHFQGAK